MRYAFLDPAEISISNPLFSGQGHILFGLEKEVYEFLSRSFVNPEFIHHMALPCYTWKQQSELSFSGQMHVILNKKTIDIACFKRGELKFLNSFEYSTPDDALYFISYTWKQTDMDQLKDRLFIFGDLEQKKALITNLKNYIHYVSEMELPTDVYLRNPELMQAPFIYLICMRIIVENMGAVVFSVSFFIRARPNDFAKENLFNVLANFIDLGINGRLGFSSREQAALHLN